MAHSPANGFKPPATHFLASSTEGEGSSTAAASVFGAPLDITESFRSGAHGGPGAVRYMSDSLESYSPLLDLDLDDLLVRDMGDLELKGMPMEMALEAIAQAMAAAAAKSRLGVMIGGEHTGSLGGYRGIKRIHPDAMLLQLDAHLDFREEYEGEPLTHASWLYHAGAEFGFDNIVQLGVRSGSRDEWRRSRELTSWSSPDLILPPSVRRQLAGKPVYLSVDIDVLDPAHAPGTGCPEPGGVTFRELERFIHELAGIQVVGMDVMEVSPNLDPANITAVAGAKVIREAALLFGR